MATLTRTEQQRLGLVRPELMQRLLVLMDRAHDEGYVTYVPDFGGYRSLATQQQLHDDAVAQGVGGDTAYAVGLPGKSRHNYGAAFDLQIENGSDDDYARLAELGESIGLVAGYYFAARGVGKKDPYHFQLDETLQESIDRWAAMKAAGIIKPLVIAAAVILAFGVLRP